MCIENYDHHCVFFSKCIGGGNILCFYGTIGGVLFNFFNIAFLIGITAVFGPFDNPGGAGVDQVFPSTMGAMGMKIAKSSKAFLANM